MASFLIYSFPFFRLQPESWFSNGRLKPVVFTSVFLKFAKSCKAQGWWGVGHPPEYLSELSHPGEWAIFLRAPVFSAVSLGSGCTFPPAQKCPAFSLVPGTPAEGDLPCQDHGPDPAVLRTCPFLAAGPVSWTRRQGMVCMPLLESEEEASLPSMSRASGKLTIGT